MKKGYTHLAILLDRSGSMQSVKNDVIGGFNSFLDKNKKDADGKCTVTLVQFDNSPYKPLYMQDSTFYWGINTGGNIVSSSPYIFESNVQDGYIVMSHFEDIKNVTPLNEETFKPRGGTAYLDALGKLINETGGTLRYLPESERPEKVVVVVYTDGYENASIKYTKAMIGDLIKHQTEKYNWEFTFLGAGMDAVTEASSFGISAANSLTYVNSAAGVNNAWGALSSNLVRFRNSEISNLAYTEEQRTAAVK